MTAEEEINAFFKRLNITHQWADIKATIADKFEENRIESALIAAARHTEKLNIDASLLVEWEEIYGRDKNILRCRLPKSNIKWLFNTTQTSMSIVYMTLTGLSFAIALLPLIQGHISPELAIITSNLGLGQAWNYSDTIGGYVVALEQYSNGLWGQALANTVSSSQLLACTLAGILGQYVFHTISALAATSLLGFSLVACMFIAAGLEHYAVIRSESNIQRLIKQIKEESDPLLKINYEQLLLLEEAQRHDYARNRNIWIGCGFAMLTVSIVALSIVSFGAPLIAVALVAAVAFTSSIIRSIYLNTNSHVIHVKTIKSETLQCWFDLLAQAYTEKLEPMDRDMIIDAKNKVSTLCTKNPSLAETTILALAKHTKAEFLSEKDISAIQHVAPSFNTNSPSDSSTNDRFGLLY